ncbi:AbrB family transcriptional regulator [Sporosarcina sp. ZBG7A]|uniref:AbrB family transcriptional regulator n=1 Tax=Sporosarcina sp. ZBG7A TaxID=1582223 RepID=UPI00350F6BB6
MIPKELRRTFDIDTGTPKEVVVENNGIIILKFSSVRACMLTEEMLDENKVYSVGNILSPIGSREFLEIIKAKH